MRATWKTWSRKHLPRDWYLKGIAILLVLILAGLLWYAVAAFCLHFIDHGGLVKNYSHMHLK